MRYLMIILSMVAFSFVSACETADMKDTGAKMAVKKKKKKKKPASGSPFTVYYKSKSTSLTDSSEGALFDIMQKVKPYKVKKARVIVHSDLAGSSRRQMAISKAVGDRLAKELKGAGVKEVTLEVMGGNEPIVNTRRRNQTNRRAIIVFIKSKKKKKT